MPSVMDYVTGLTKVGLKIRRRAHLFRGPSPTRLHPSYAFFLFTPCSIFREIARSNWVCMEIEYKSLGTQSQFFPYYPSLFVKRCLSYFRESHLSHFIFSSSNLLHHMLSLSSFNANTICIIPRWMNSESRILDLIR